MDPKLDGRNRAARTFIQGLLIDVLAAVMLVLVPAINGSDFAWSAAFWLTLLGLVAKSALVAAVSYIARQVTPPAPAVRRAPSAPIE